MKTRIVLLLLLSAFLLLSTGAISWSGPPRYRLESAALPGGTVQLPGAGVQSDLLAAGGSYRLAIRPAADSVTGAAGSGCCCSWLPSVLKPK